MHRVCITTGNLKKNTTGMGTYTFQVLDMLKTEFDIDIIKHPDGDPIEGCNTREFNYIPGPYWYFSWSKSLSITKKPWKNYEVFHNITQFPISPSISKNYAITVYDLIPILYPEYVTPFYAWQSKLFLPGILKKASLILSISQYTKLDIVKRYHINPEKIHVTPLGASDHFHPATPIEIQSFCKRYKLNNPFILFVGAIEPKKNIPSIIKAFYQVKQKKQELDLVIAGKKSWKYQEVFHLISSLKLDKSVHFLDFISYNDLPHLYSAAKVFIFPSNYEGFGLPPLEAMKCGTPVIVSNKSSLPEIVGPEGVMVEPRNYAELANRILSLVENESLREEHILYSLERSKKFTWERCADITKKAYYQLMDY